MSRAADWFRAVWRGQSGLAAAGPGSVFQRPRRRDEQRLMIDHLGIPVSDYARSKAFYERALAPLGYRVVTEVQQHGNDAPAVGFGTNGRSDLWLGGEGGLGRSVHVALAAASRLQVDAFHRAALAAGGRDNGPPGLRPEYHPNYYAAFVLDPDGHNIEAVCHRPE
jgi:catechol 2,3-dioxygenase-like lactoylglutathione lyase family enzyme